MFFFIRSCNPATENDLTVKVLTIFSPLTPITGRHNSTIALPLTSCTIDQLILSLYLNAQLHHFNISYLKLAVSLMASQTNLWFLQVHARDYSFTVKGNPVRIPARTWVIQGFLWIFPVITEPTWKTESYNLVLWTLLFWKGLCIPKGPCNWRSLSMRFQSVQIVNITHSF